MHILSANVTSYYSVKGLVEAIGDEVDIVLIQEHRLHGDALEAAKKFVKGHGFHSQWVACEVRGIGKSAGVAVWWRPWHTVVGEPHEGLKHRSLTMSFDFRENGLLAVCVCILWQSWCAYAVAPRKHH